MASAAPKAPPLPLLRALAWFRDGLAALHRRLVPGHIALLELSTAGYLTQAACAAAELGIADALASDPSSRVNSRVPSAPTRPRCVG